MDYLAISLSFYLSSLSLSLSLSLLQLYHNLSPLSLSVTKYPSLSIFPCVSLCLFLYASLYAFLPASLFHPIAVSLFLYHSIAPSLPFFSTASLELSFPLSSPSLSLLVSLSLLLCPHPLSQCPFCQTLSSPHLSLSPLSLSPCHLIQRFVTVSTSLPTLFTPARGPPVHTSPHF